MHFVEEERHTPFTIIQQDITKMNVDAMGVYLFFLGANIDAVQTAGQMGIRPDWSADYVRDSKGTRLNFQMMGEAVAEFRVAGSVPEECLDAIREDVKKRG